MFPRDARNTRSTSRSSSVSTQNSHDAKAPETSVQQAPGRDVSGSDLEIHRPPKPRDVAIAGLDLGRYAGLHPIDAEVAGLCLGSDGKRRVHADGQLAADADAGKPDAALRAAELEAGFVVQG